MSGIEAVGVVLGILPLIISAAEHYETTVRPFTRFIRFAPELSSFRQQLRTQKAIFINECRLLLAALVGRAQATEMMTDHAHPSWSDDGLEREMCDQLGGSGEACVDIIKLIEAKLAIIEGESIKFQGALPTPDVSKICR